MKIIEKIVDLETGETTNVERDLTVEEMELAQDFEAKAATKAKTLQDKLIAKTALLDRLGITEDEAKLLLS